MSASILPARLRTETYLQQRLGPLAKGLQLGVPLHLPRHRLLPPAALRRLRRYEFI